MQLYIVRNGETFHNIEQQLAGQCDGKLTEQGIIQAQLTGQKLENEKFEKIYVSTLGRATETYKYISENLKYIGEAQTIQFTKDIVQRANAQFQDNPKQMYFKAIEESKTPLRDFKPIGGQSLNDVNKRALTFFQQLVSENLNCINLNIKKSDQSIQQEDQKMDDESGSKLKEKDGQIAQNLVKILIITHGVFTRQLTNVCGFFKDKQEPVSQDNSKNCSITIIDIECNPQENCISNITSVLESLDISFQLDNDISHLNA